MSYNAYIDGFNLYKGVLERRPELKWLNLVSFCEAALHSDELGKIYYFTADVAERYAGDDAPRRQQKYLRVLRNQGIEVVRGKFSKNYEWKRLVSSRRASIIEPELASHFGLTQRAISKSFRSAMPDSPKANVLRLEEKGSDVNLASYLLRDAYSGHIQNALVITGDSDLVTPIKFAQQAGVRVTVAVPNRRQKCDALRGAASQLWQIHPTELLPHLLPRTFISKSGRMITRPEEWA